MGKDCRVFPPILGSLLESLRVVATDLLPVVSLGVGGWMIWTVVVRVTIVPRFHPIFAVGLNFWCPGRIASVCTLKEVRDAAQAEIALSGVVF